LFISKVVIKNYRCLRESTTKLNEKLNIIVGNNECGKSTLLEAIHLTLSGQLNGRPLATELHPYLFNQATVRDYLDALLARRGVRPPEILVELYFADIPALAAFKGHNNSLKENVPGVKLLIEFNEDYKVEYSSYIADPKLITTVPVEYYVARLRDFRDSDITPRSVPIKPCLIDASTIRNNAGASRYVVDLMKDSLSRKEQVDLALSYRLMRDRFVSEPKVLALNAELAKKKGTISNKQLAVSLDTSPRFGWETSIMPQLDDMPITLVGKGEQNSVKVKLALETSAESHLILVEEPENHLSHSNLNALINHISKTRRDRQLIITTHSSFVLNKLGVENVLLFGRDTSATLNAVSKETREYFLRLPGHDTLRLILAERTILVEGPSDELIVQAAYKKKHGKLPLEAGVDVISVRSLAFKRFLELSKLLHLQSDVVTDNDGDIEALKTKYSDYFGEPRIKIHYDDDVEFKTLEPQLVKANGLAVVNDILGKAFKNEDELTSYMESNKTDVALRFFETEKEWVPPKYVEAAIG
jgi:putative ATP-dependent endonuclease of the OLD family